MCRVPAHIYLGWSQAPRLTRLHHALTFLTLGSHLGEDLLWAWGRGGGGGCKRLWVGAAACPRHPLHCQYKHISVMGEPPGAFALPRKDLLPAAVHSYYMKEQTNKQTLVPKMGNWVLPTPNLGNLDLGVKFFPWVFFSLLIFGRAGSSLLHGLFSSFGEWGLLSSCGARASH